MWHGLLQHIFPGNPEDDCQDLAPFSRPLHPSLSVLFIYFRVAVCSIYPQIPGIHGHDFLSYVIVLLNVFSVYLTDQNKTTLAQMSWDCVIMKRDPPP